MRAAYPIVHSSERIHLYELRSSPTIKGSVYLIGDSFLEKNVVPESKRLVFAIDPLKIKESKNGGFPRIGGFANPEISDIILGETDPVFIFQQVSGDYWNSFGSEIVDFVKKSMQEYSKKREKETGKFFRAGVRPIVPYKNIEVSATLCTYIMHFKPSAIEFRAPNSINGADAGEKAGKLMDQLKIFNPFIQYSVPGEGDKN